MNPVYPGPAGVLLNRGPEKRRRAGVLLAVPGHQALRVGPPLRVVAREDEAPDRALEPPCLYERVVRLLAVSLHRGLAGRGVVAEVAPARQQAAQVPVGGGQAGVLPVAPQRALR